jgi:23S rRNA pseudouridine1911/1915/1917 synthase
MDTRRPLSPDPLRVTIPEELDGERLDRALASLLPGLGRSAIRRLIDAGHVLVDGSPAAKASMAASGGSTVIVRPQPAPPADEPRPQAIDLVVVYEDDDLVVVNKPAGLVVHSGAGFHGETLVNALLFRYGSALSRQGGAERPGIVHRLDKGTSGVIAVARSDATHDALVRQFQARTVEKEYAAIVFGSPAQNAGVVDLPIGRDRTDRTKISANTDRPREASTRWQLDEDLDGFALLRAWPKTGRTHQIRVHLASIHHPCVGDARYAGARWKNEPDAVRRRAARDFARPALHALRLSLDHPRTGERMVFSAPLPDDLESLLSTLRGAPSEPC